MAIRVRNLQRKIRLDTRRLKRVGERALARLGRPEAECSVALVDDARIARLNAQYRGRPEATDVLAFPMGEGPLRRLHPHLLGDVVISVETAARQARARGLDAQAALLLVHGLLHLQGYDHQTPKDRRRMGRAQRAILRAIAGGGGR